MLANRSSSPEEFFKNWVKLIHRQAKKDAFFGCPVVSFANSLESELALRDKADKIVQSWIHQLAKVFAPWASKSKSASKILADQVMTLYQGRAALFRATRNQSYLANLEQEFLALFS